MRLVDYAVSEHVVKWSDHLTALYPKTGRLSIGSVWAAIPPREAAWLAIESAEALDRRLESLPPALLEVVYSQSQRWVVRAMHRDGHLDEIDAALKR